MARPQLSPEESAEMLRDYWRESRRPLVSLVFISPLLVAYEGGILLLGPEQMRNGAEVWLRSLLSFLGFGQYFLLPVLTVGLLLGWHHVMRDRWYVPTQVLYGMAGECTSLAIVLVVIAHLQGSILGSVSPMSVGANVEALQLNAVAPVGAAYLSPRREPWVNCSQIMKSPVGATYAAPTGLTYESLHDGPRADALGYDVSPLTGLVGNVIIRTFAKAIGYCGAGIYEELLFRLILLTGLVSLFNVCRVPPLRAVAAAVAVSSLLFSLAHYIGPQGDTFTFYSFLFRFIAGVFFAVLFVKRGFGIAAGTHALYDIIVGLL